MNQGLIGVLIVLLLPVIAAGDPREVPLHEAVAAAEQHAVAVIRAAGTRRSADAAVRSSWGAFLPSVNLSAGANRQLPAGGSTRVENGQVITVADEPWSSSLGVGASVELFAGGRRLFELGQARAQQVSARSAETLARFDAALAAKQAYFDILAARESAAAAAAQLRQAEQQRTVAVARRRARTATRSDSLRAEIQVRTAELAVTDAANARAAADVTLARAMGTEDDVTAATTAGSEADIALGDSALATLVLAGPAVRAAAAELDAARAARRTAWTNYVPALSAAWSRSGSGTSDAPDFGPGGLSWNGSVRLSLSLPVFDGFQREARVVQADVAVRNAEAGLRDARLAAREAFVQTIGTWHASEERVRSQAATVEAAEEDLRVQQQRYALGESTQLDVLTSQTQLDQSRRDLIRARYDQRVAKARLEALVGRDL